MVLTKLATVFMGWFVSLFLVPELIHLSLTIERFRLRTFELLSRAYSSLPLSLAEKYLGASGEAIVSGMLIMHISIHIAKRLKQRQPRMVGPLTPTLNCFDRKLPLRRRRDKQVCK